MLRSYGELDGGLGECTRSSKMLPSSAVPMSFDKGVIRT